MNEIKKRNLKKKVLIACQSTIPHYRIAFYQMIERQKPNWWEYSVVYDKKGKSHKKYFEENVDTKIFKFKVHDTKTLSKRINNKRIALQTFVFSAWKYDLIVVGSELKNLSYPLAFIYKLVGIPVMIWGHGKDYGVENPSGMKKIYEGFKLWLSRKADGFFAYTDSVKEYLVRNGEDEHKIFTLYNTIDINRQRRIFDKVINRREEIRKKEGLEGHRGLLYVGRLNRRKRLDFLAEAFSILKERDQSYKLVVVGGGDLSSIESLKTKYGEESVDYRGIITESAELAPLYVGSDVYVFPGDVGLGPVQALCYDLTPVVIDSPTHNPEYEYLHNDNAVILPVGTSPQEYASAIDDLILDVDRWTALRAKAWPSIEHLTIENMAQHFIDGINAVLGQG